MKSLNENSELWSGVTAEMLEDREEYAACISFCFDCICFKIQCICFCFL